MVRKSVLVCLSAVQLVACGGGGSGSDSPKSPAPKSQTVQVIDGYLESVTVCVDRNLDNKCQRTEFIEGKTDAFGRLDVATIDLDYPLIANMTAGESKDSDQLVPANNSYQMVAPAGITAINPFTTVAHLSDKTISELASELGLSTEVLTGNFVQHRSQQIDASIAHLVARSITSQFSPSLGETSEKSIHSKMMALKQKASELSNQHGIEELNRIILRQLPDGSVVDDARMVTSLANYLKDNGQFQISTMSQDGDMKMATFDGQHAIGTLTDSEERAYTTSGSKLVLAATDTDPEATYEFIYISHFVSISYEARSKTLQAWMHKELGPNFEIEIRDDQLRSQQLTLLTPSSDGDLKVVSLSFSAQGNQVDVDFYDATPDTRATWSIESIPQAPDVIHIQPPEGSKAPRISLAILEDAASHWVGFDHSNGRPSVLFNDQNLAHRIFDYWSVRNDRFIHGHYTLSDAISGSELHYYPMTNSLESVDIISAYQFLPDNQLCESDYRNSWVCEFNYSLLFHDLRLSHKETYDLNFRRSNQFLIGFGQQGYPGIWLRNPQNRLISPELEWFDNKTWHWIRDINSDANGTAKPTLVTMKFLANNSVEIITPDAEPFITQWQFRPYVDEHRSFNSIYIELPEQQRDIDSLRGEDFIQFGAMAKADDAMVIEVISTNTIARENILLRSKDLAGSFVESWQ